jgi:hypothetical protein
MRVVVVPGALALLSAYASIDDPVPELRTACHEAVAWLVGPGAPVTVYCTPQSLRIARQLVGDAGGQLHVAGGPPAALLVIANGSAKRTEKAPGHFDDRAEVFDNELGQALRGGDSTGLAAIDESLARELWADVDAFRSLGSEIDLSGADIEVDYDAAPYGVQYWVTRATCAS